MDKKQVIEIVRRYKIAVKAFLPNSRVYLYGSYSKGNAHKDSDIDVAIVVPELQGDWLATSSKLWGATWDIDTKIEPILLEDIHPSPLYQDVMHTGIAI